MMQMDDIVSGKFEKGRLLRSVLRVGGAYATSA